MSDDVKWPKSRLKDQTSFFEYRTSQDQNHYSQILEWSENSLYDARAWEKVNHVGSSDCLKNYSASAGNYNRELQLSSKFNFSKSMPFDEGLNCYFHNE